MLEISKQKMGRLTEFFKYLEIDPNQLQDFKKETAYIDIDKNEKTYKKIRRKHLANKRK